MSYSAHNFIVGDRLTAEALNEIDAQVEINTAAQENHQNFIDDFANLIKEEIRNNLHIVKESGSDSFTLYYGPANTPSQQISLGAVAMPIDTSNFVPCSGVQITQGSNNMILNIGETYPFTAQKTPSNTTQTLRWELGDSTVGIITTGGQFTANNVGKTSVTAACGDNSQSINVNVQKRITFTSSELDSISWLAPSDATYWPRAITASKAVSNSRRDGGVANCAANNFLFSKYKIGPNQTLTIDFRPSVEHVEFNRIIIFKQYSPQVSMRTEDESNNTTAPAYRLREVEVLDISPRIHEWYNKYGSVHGEITQQIYNTGWGYHGGLVDENYENANRPADDYGPNSYKYVNNSQSDVYFIFNVLAGSEFKTTDSNEITVFDLDQIATWLNQYTDVIIRSATTEELAE